MRLPAVFARGAFGATVLASALMGAGSASAQIVAGVPDTVAEGGRIEIPVVGRFQRAASSTAIITVQATAASAPGTTDPRTSRATAAESGDWLLERDEVTLENSATTVSGRLELAARPDADAEDEAVRLTFTLTNITGGAVRGADGEALSDPDTHDIIIKDSDVQGFEWVNLSENPTEGQDVTVTLRANPSPVNLIWPALLSVDTSGYVVSPASATLDAGTVGRLITITPPSQDRNRTDDTVVLRAVLQERTSDLPELEPLSIEFADIHGLPDGDKITARAYRDNNGSRTNTVATLLVEGGAPVHVEVTVDRGSDGYPLGEALVVRPYSSPDQSRDFRMDPSSIEIAAGTGPQSAVFRVWAEADDDVGDESLVLNLVVTGTDDSNGSGESEADRPFTIDIGDGTTPRIRTKPAPAITSTVNTRRTLVTGGDGRWTPGDDDINLGTEDLFSAQEIVSLSARSSNPSVVSASAAGDTITLTAMSAGTATITVTGSVAGSGATQTSQTVNTATVEFDVEVDEEPLEIMLSASDLDIDEGMSVTVTATANRPVTEEQRITLHRVAGSATSRDYTVGAIMIASGQMTGTTQLTATLDDRMEDPEQLTLEGRWPGENSPTNTLVFTITDVVMVPALPVVASLLLAVFLAVGGCRRYLRR